MQPRLSLAGGVEHSGEHGTGARGHESMTRSHRMREGEQANTSRPRKWPEGKAEAAVIMDGEAEIIGTCG